LEESYEVLKDVINQGGVKSVAIQMGLPQPLLYKWCNDSKEDEDSYTAPTGASNPPDRIRKLYEITNDSRIIKWVCHTADGILLRILQWEKNIYTVKCQKQHRSLLTSFQKLLR